MPSARNFVAVLAVVGGYAFGVRPRLRRWGATDEEVRRPYPGADLIPGAERASTMAVTIDAPPSRVWPWLAQIGADRAGWYSWDRLDNGGRPSAERIHPEWQEISIGDRLSAWGPTGPVSAWEVAVLEPERFLGLRGLSDLRGRPFEAMGTWPRFYTAGLWGFLLEELPGGRTRLVVSGYQSIQPRWLQAVVDFIVYPPTHWIMQTRQFANLKRRAERDSAGPDQPPAKPTAVPGTAR